MGESVTESEGEIIISVRIFGVNFKGLPEINNRLVHLPLFHQDEAEIIIGLCGTGVNFKSFSEIESRFIQLALFHQDVAETIVGVCEISLNCKGLSEMNNGVIQLALSHQGVTEIALSQSVVRSIGESMTPQGFTTSPVGGLDIAVRRQSCYC